MDELLKKFLTAKLDSILTAIEEYNWRGAAGLEEAVSAAFGSGVFRAQTSTSEKEKGCWRAFFDVLWVTAQAVAIINGLAQLPVTIRNALLVSPNQTYSESLAGRVELIEDHTINLEKTSDSA